VLPLTDLRVLDLSRLLPGPFATLLLAELGADVVKIEGPAEGDYLRYVPPLVGGTGAQFIALNRGKRSLALNLKCSEGRETFLRLVEHSDVVVESMRPGTMERLGLGRDTLRARNPDLVVVSVSGYGQSGPWAKRAGHDLTYEALGGLLGMWRRRDSAPSVPAVQVADLVGGVFAALAVVTAVLAREQGKPCLDMDVSLAESALALMLPDFAAFTATHEEPRQDEGLLRGGSGAYNVYATKDGAFLAVAALEPKFWEQLTKAIGRPIPRSGMNDPTVRETLNEIFREKTLAEWQAIFALHDACVEPVLSFAELPLHPQHEARRVFFAEKGAGPESVVGMRTPLAPPHEPRPAPKLGEHTREVLLEAGFSESEVAALSAQGAIALGA